jgi:hypothetical protein
MEGQIAPDTNVLRLSALIAVLAVAATNVGLFWDDGGEPFDHQTVRGEVETFYGRGIYRNETAFMAGSSRGADTVALFGGVPLLIVSAALARRGSTRANLTLLGALGYFLYLYCTFSLKLAYNSLFLVYVALFGSSLWAFILHFSTTARWTPVAPMPRRLPALFMLATGVITGVIWLEAPIRSVVTGEPPVGLGALATLVTHALDLAIIIPAAMLSGLLILRGQSVGYLIAFSLLVLEASLLPLMVFQTIFQLQAGVTFTAREVVGLFTGFTVLSAGATVVLVTLLRNIPAIDVDRGWHRR